METEATRIWASTNERVKRAAREQAVELERKVSQAEILDDAMGEYERHKAEILRRKRRTT